MNAPRAARRAPSGAIAAPRERRALARRDKGPAVGTVVDRRYQLTREIARGGMSVVFEATHQHTGRVVAVKMLRGEFEARHVVRERLLREARVLESARHPNLVEVLDAGVCPSGRPFVVLEMLEGRTFDGLLTARGRLPIADTVHVARQLCDVLAYAHARGVVHRDLKPSNVFLTLDKHGLETVKLFDFGIAALAAGGELDAVTTGDKLTRAGELIGTVEYMAPEQLMARPDVDFRCDIFALGMTLFECVTGQLPYSGTLGELILHFATRGAPLAMQSLRADAPAALVAAVERAIAPQPADRFPDAHAFADALIAATGLARGRSTLLGAFQPPPGVRVPRDLDAPASREARGAEQRAAAPAPVSATAAQPASRRRLARAPYLTPVRVVTADGRAHDGRVEDISTGGMMVVTGELCHAGERVKLRFALPITGTVVAVDAVVRWSRVARGRAATGVEFVGLPADAAAVVTRYIGLIGPLPE